MNAQKEQEQGKQEDSEVFLSRREEIGKTLGWEILVAQLACLRNAGKGSGDKKPE